MLEVVVALALSLSVIGSALYFHVSALKENQIILQLQAIKSYAREIGALHNIYLCNDQVPDITMRYTDSLAALCDTSCDSTAHLQFLTNEWRKRLSEEFPEVVFQVKFSDSEESYISIGWQNKNMSDEFSRACKLDVLPDGFSCYTIIIPANIGD